MKSANSAYHLDNSKSTPVFVVGKPHPIGQIVGDTFYKTGLIYRALDGFALEVSLIERLKKAGVGVLSIKCKENRLTYYINLADFIRHAQPIQHDGYEPQLVCPRKFFQASGHEQMAFRLVNST